jgi:hypothetical protein
MRLKSSGTASCTTRRFRRSLLGRRCICATRIDLKWIFSESLNCVLE